MLVAYVDDSGSEGKGHACVLAGYLSYPEHWRNFSEEWQLCLNGPPRIQYFKMAQAHRLREQFQGWSTEQRDNLINKLTTVIKQFVVRGVTSVVWWEDFRKFEQCFDHPIHAYNLLFNKTIASILDFMIRNDINDQLEVIFDEQGCLGASAGSIFDWIVLSMSPQYRDRLAGRPVHRDEKRVLPLQAADMIAWNVRRCITETGIEPQGIALQLQDIPTIQNVFGPDKLQRLSLDVQELRARFPNLRSILSEEELSRIRSLFLGRDPSC